MSLWNRQKNCRLICEYSGMSENVRARVELQKYRDAYRLRRIKLEQISDIEDRLMSLRSMDYSGDIVQSSPRGDAIPRAVAELLDAQMEYAKQEQDAMQTQRAVQRLIQRLEDEDEREVLSWRYIRCLHMDKIAQKMYLSERQVYRIAGMAEQHIEQILEEDDKNNMAIKDVIECHVDDMI